MLSVDDFLARLSEPERQGLIADVEAGLRDVESAARCLAGPSPRVETVPLLFAYLMRAIERLDAARDLVRRRA